MFSKPRTRSGTSSINNVIQFTVRQGTLVQQPRPDQFFYITDINLKQILLSKLQRIQPTFISQRIILLQLQQRPVDYIKGTMTELSPDQYQNVLRYMQATNEDNFEQAILILSEHYFDLDSALKDKRNVHRSGTMQSSRYSQQDEAIVRRYLEYLQKKNAEWNMVRVIFDYVKAFLLGIFATIGHVIPSSIRLRYFGTDFQKRYVGVLPAHFIAKPLPDLLKQTKNINSKSVMVVVSSTKAHPDVLSFLTRPDLQKTVSRCFWLTGHILGHKQLTIVEKLSAPMLLVLRRNIFDELIVISRCKDLQKIEPFQLQRWSQQGRNLYKRDRNVLIKCQNFANRSIGYFYEEQEQEEIDLSEIRNHSKEIAHQNRLYQQMEEQIKKNREHDQERKKQQEDEQRKRKQLQEERKIRKSSIPPQPKEGNLIKLHFRCPDGSVVVRNFDLQEKMGFVFQWIELNDEIEFEDEARTFEMYFNYPPQPLSARKGELLSEIFDCPQQKIVIREL